MIRWLTEHEFLEKLGTNLKDVEQFMKETLGTNIPYFKHQGHQWEIMYMAAYSLMQDYENPFNEILEVGTGNGHTSRILAELFQYSFIHTIDLPKEQFNKYTQERDENFSSLNKIKNVFYVEKNSFFLPSIARGNYDLVWLDGGHSYPEVAWDLSHCYEHCKIILGHDYKPGEPDVVDMVGRLSEMIPEDIHLIPAGPEVDRHHHWIFHIERDREAVSN